MAAENFQFLWIFYLLLFHTETMYYRSVIQICHRPNQHRCVLLLCSPFRGPP